MAQTGRVAVAVFVASMLMIGGCARKAASPPQPAAQKASIPLPEWAPKNPSPEFLRAAKVLGTRPWDPARDSTGNDLVDRSLQAKHERVSYPAWEFFGTLSDQEVHRLFASKVAAVGDRPASLSRAMTLPYKSMSHKQKAAFNRYLDVWRETYEGTDLAQYGEGLVPDRLVVLYKHGAKEDLSNVLITFEVLKNHLVRAAIYVVQSDGSLSAPLIMAFGYS
jgi:hypothetical protein